jgi:hypothetical protein
MPIFARTKMLIEDDCIRQKIILMDYHGPNPQNIYKQIRILLKSIFKVRDEEIEEKIFDWDRSEPEERFKVHFILSKDVDPHSYYHIEVNLSGKAAPSKEFGKEGEAKIQIEAVLRTEYPQDTFWQRSIFYELFRIIFHNVIYKGERYKLLEDCKELTMRFYNELKNYLNVLPRGG